MPVFLFSQENCKNCGLGKKKKKKTHWFFTSTNVLHTAQDEKKLCKISVVRWIKTGEQSEPRVQHTCYKGTLCA